MIVWGGWSWDGNSVYYNTGGRYNPGADTWTATSTVGAPVARYYHTAVWTGTEMIIWGGDSAGYFNTGGRYAPEFDSWIPTTTVNAPSGRYFHTAVWAGTEMIIWGGLDGNYVNTGGRYAPGTDSWTATSITGAPLGRTQHTAIWTGTEMIVWGGYADLGQYLKYYYNTGGRYTPGSNSWTATSTTNAPSERKQHTAVWTGSSMIVWGGYYHDGYNPFVLNTGGRYSPAGDSWSATSLTNVPRERALHTAVLTDTEMIIWGGEDAYGGCLNDYARYCTAVTIPACSAPAFGGVDAVTDLSICASDVAMGWSRRRVGAPRWRTAALSLYVRCSSGAPIASVITAT
jgi:N-acetylneuraminic acid mutarotase